MHPGEHLVLDLIVPRHPVRPRDVGQVVVSGTGRPPERIIEAGALLLAGILPEWHDPLAADQPLEVHMLAGQRVDPGGGGAGGIGGLPKIALIVSLLPAGIADASMGALRRPREAAILDATLDLLQRLFWPTADTPRAAVLAAHNGGLAGWIMAANHLLFGAFLLFAGMPVGPAIFQLAVGFVYVVLAVATWRGERIASVVLPALVVLEALVELAVLGRLRWFAVVHLAVLILAIGGVRGTFALARFRRATKAR